MKTLFVVLFLVDALWALNNLTPWLSIYLAVECIFYAHLLLIYVAVFNVSAVDAFESEASRILYGHPPEQPPGDTLDKALAERLSARNHEWRVWGCAKVAANTGLLLEHLCWGLPNSITKMMLMTKTNVVFVAAIFLSRHAVRRLRVHWNFFAGRMVPR